MNKNAEGPSVDIDFGAKGETKLEVNADVRFDAAMTNKRQIEVPISKATGGLLPGFDPIKLCTQAQELDDTEYVERMKHFK